MLFVYLDYNQPVLTLEGRPAYKHLSQRHSEVETGFFYFSTDRPIKHWA